MLTIIDHEKYKPGDKVLTIVTMPIPPAWHSLSNTYPTKNMILTVKNVYLINGGTVALQFVEIFQVDKFGYPRKSNPIFSENIFIHFDDLTEHEKKEKQIYQFNLN